MKRSNHSKAGWDEHSCRAPRLSGPGPRKHPTSRALTGRQHLRCGGRAPAWTTGPSSEGGRDSQTCPVQMLPHHLCQHDASGLRTQPPPQPQKWLKNQRKQVQAAVALTDLATGHVRIWERQPEPSSQKAHKDGRESEMHRKSISASGSH